MIPRRIFWLFDIIVIVVAFLVAYQIVPYILPLFSPGGPLRTPWLDELFSPYIWNVAFPPLIDYAWVFLVMAPITIGALGILGNHAPLLYQSRTRLWVGSLLAPFVGLSAITLVLYALKTPEWSRLFVFSFALLSGIFLVVYRWLLRRYFQYRQAAGYYAKHVLLIGLASAVEGMAAYFAETVPEADAHIIGYLRICADQSVPTPTLHGTQSIALTPMGDVQELGDLMIHRPIDEVIAIHPTSGGEWIKQVIEDCDYFGVLLRIVPEALLFGGRKSLRTLFPFEPLHLPAVVVAPPHRDADALFFKRLFDFVVSATLLVLLSPLFLVVALAIKLTTPDLPVFYAWHVVGCNGRRFTGYKFSTMVADADARKAELGDRNEMVGPVFKIADDPRVTPLGRILRKFSINELPQLWSVFLGDMSLVGPRPAFPHELERYEFWHKRKLSIQPGITCLWQIRGRNKISNFDDWVRMDLEYIDNWSLWLDFKILLRTAWVVVRGTGS
jgi:exopolysaccharide biosynthesis polyprenyl glycosylphosphotransferase